MTAAVDQVADRYGRIDVLVNNAGIIDTHAVHDTPEDVWDRVIAVNLTSVYLLSQAVIPRLPAGGSIVNITSVHALATVPRAPAYVASKGAVLALTRQMALDYYDAGVRVNAVVVGSVATEMSAAHGAGIARAESGWPRRPARSAGRRAGRGGRGGAVPGLAARASFFSGSPFVVDGGMLARLV